MTFLKISTKNIKQIIASITNRPYLRMFFKTLIAILGGNFLLKHSPFQIGKSNASHQEVNKEPFFPSRFFLKISKIVFKVT